MSAQAALRLFFPVLVFSAVAFPDSISSIVVYGDSLSDNGNYYAATGKPGPPYYPGTQSNGPVAVEQMATSLGVPLIDYAWIGATTGIGNYDDSPQSGTPTSFGSMNLPGMLTELSNTRNSLGPYLGGLFIVWGGPNDFLSPSPLDAGNYQAIITRAVGDLVTIVETLQSEGATHILVPGMPDLGLTPYFLSLGPAEAAQASALTDAFNAALVANLPAGVQYVDTASLLRGVVADPSHYGFTDVTDACFNGVTVCSDPADYLFFDEFHPTTQADALVAQAFLNVVTPEPASAALLLAGLLLIVFTAVRRAGSNSRDDRSPCR